MKGSPISSRAALLLPLGWGVLLPLVFSPDHSDSSRAPQLIALGAVATFGALLRLRRTRLLLPKLPVLLLLLPTLWGALSLTQAVAWSAGMEPLLLQGMLAVTFMLSYAAFREQPALLMWLVRGAGISTVVLCAWGGWQLYAYPEGPNMPPFANQGNRNFLAEGLLMLLPVSLMGFASVSRKERWIHLLPVLAAISLMALAGSRGALLGLGALVLMLWPLMSLSRLSRSLLLKPWLALPMALLLAAGGCLIGLQRLPQPVRHVLQADPIPRILHGTTSAEERIILWRHSVHEANAHPVMGVGLGQWKLVAGRNGIRGFHQAFATRYYTSAHNDPLQVAAEQGWVGLLLTLAFPLATLVAGVRGIRRARSWREVWLLALPLAGLCAYAVAGCFGFPRERPLTAGLQLLLCCMVWMWLSTKEWSPPSWAVGAASIAVSALCMAWGAAWLRSDGHAVQMEQARKRQDWEKVRREATLAEGRWMRFEDASATPFAWHLGLAWFHQGQYAQAASELRRARSLSPWHPQVLNALGSAEGMGGDLPASEEAYREAMRLHPDWEEVALNLAQVLRALGRVQDAIHLLEQEYQGPASPAIDEALKALRQQEAQAQVADPAL